MKKLAVLKNFRKLSQNHKIRDIFRPLLLKSLSQQEEKLALMAKHG